MNKLIALILFVAVGWSCEKQTPEPAPTLSEYIIGDWEEREYMDYSAFGNFEFNSIGPPYLAIYRFKEDETFELWSNGYPDPARLYSVNEQDSIIMLISIPWKLYSFNERFLDIRKNTGSGPIGKRLYKID
ncbi:MAG: hypothetical protein Sapg2KO_46470 [Saprospiraceae bacterium]